MPFSPSKLKLLCHLVPLRLYFLSSSSSRIKRALGKFRVLSERPALQKTGLATLTADLNFLCEFVSHWRRFGLHASQLVSAEGKLLLTILDLCFEKAQV